MAATQLKSILPNKFFSKIKFLNFQIVAKVYFYQQGTKKKKDTFNHFAFQS